MSKYTQLFEHAATRYEPVSLPVERLLVRRDRKRRNQRVTAGVVGVAFFVAAVWATTGGLTDRSQSVVPGEKNTQPSVIWPPQTSTVTEAGPFVGLPAPGATPSEPEHGRLVLSLGSNSATMFVYADGRVIWGDEGILPSPVRGPTEGATGFVEQRLTPDGVEFLRTQVISTGLFEHDLELLSEPGDPPYLFIEVRNGARIVRLTWAVSQNGIVPKNTPAPTAAQASALGEIDALLSAPGSWPATAWEDKEPKTFVPSRYQVWLHHFYGGGASNPGARAWALLPAAAADILSHGSKLKTEDARALAEVLNEAGLEHWAAAMGEPLLRYVVEDPDHPGELVLYFDPILPHGESLTLGPG